MSETLKTIGGAMALVGFGGTALVSRLGVDGRISGLLSLVGGVGMFLLAKRQHRIQRRADTP